MIDGSEKRNRQLAFELQNSHVCEKRSKTFRRKAHFALIIASRAEFLKKYNVVCWVSLRDYMRFKACVEVLNL